MRKVGSNCEKIDFLNVWGGGGGGRGGGENSKKKHEGCSGGGAVGKALALQA